MMRTRACLLGAFLLVGVAVVAAETGDPHFLPNLFPFPNSNGVLKTYIDGLPANTDDILFADTKLTLKRPLLGYPTFVFTDKYAADPITLLRNASDTMLTKDPRDREAFGIADPDLDSVEITVELQTLKVTTCRASRPRVVHQVPCDAIQGI